MIFQDNVIKEYLRNVYFISGTPCGGKTTVSRALAEKHGLPVYDIDEMFEIHRALSDKEIQHNMNRQFRNADEFFGRSVEEYRNWLIGNTREQLDYVLLDLIKLSREGIVLCDCHLTLEQAAQITDPSRAAFLIKEPIDIVDEYCSRPDHQGFSDFIRSASDFEKAKEVCNKTLLSLNMDFYRNVRSSGYFYVDRSDGRSREETVRLVEEHFGLIPDNEIGIVRIENGSADAERLARFIENSAWTDVKDHIAKLIRDSELTDWETMFAAEKDGRIIGMCSVMKTDYYPMPEVFPWVSCIFVDEAYRGHRISGRLIDHANGYLKALGFEHSYIPTEYAGLYERYGYRYLREIVNYGGGTDHLYVKKL